MKVKGGVRHWRRVPLWFSLEAIVFLKGKHMRKIHGQKDDDLKLVDFRIKTKGVEVFEHNLNTVVGRLHFKVWKVQSLPIND